MNLNFWVPKLSGRKEDVRVVENADSEVSSPWFGGEGTGALLVPKHPQWVSAGRLQTTHSDASG